MKSPLCKSKEELSELFAFLGFDVTISSEKEYSAYQDWDLECANADKVIDFTELYNNANLSNPQKEALGKLILASLDKAYTKYGESNSTVATKAVKNILIADQEIQKENIIYWAKLNSDKSTWQVTPFARKILKEIQYQL